ncbi:MAG: rhomboid family intramembrane serine protease [Gammaproteobacteria bacterium]|nr:MAG: rhomboid family intramembrane serine protease [Gammaproteobacteria bacterium]
MIPLRDHIAASRVPYVTYAVIGASVLVFLWQLSLGEHGGQQAVYALGAIPAVIFGHARLPADIAMVPPLATVFTSMFLHGGWLHLIGNMLYMWIFANNVEDSMGHLRFIVFYLLAGVVAVLAQSLPDTSSQVPMIGASGAISGVLGAYLMLFPRARVLVLIPLGFILKTVYLPAAVVLGFYFVLQVVMTAIAPEGGGVAFAAHLGGFVAGAALIPVFKHRRVPLFSKRR